jgi:two-component system, LytTR family, response regulator AlgR
MTTKIFIVDDEAPARNRLRTLIDDIQTEHACEVVGEADNPQSALDGITASMPDVVLLDVQMPAMTGLELAQLIAMLHGVRPDFRVPAIVLVTAFDDYALQAFEVNAIDYLLKPVRATRLAEAIARVKRRAGNVTEQTQAQTEAINIIAASDPNAKKARQHFTIVERNRVTLVPVEDVVFLKAEQKYLTLFTPQREYLLEESLISIEEELPNVFIRVHRNAIVARNAIVGVERSVHKPSDAEEGHEKGGDSWQVVLKDCNERLPISRRQWAVVKALVR